MPRDEAVGCTARLAGMRVGVDLRDGCAALVLPCRPARTLMGKGVPPQGGALVVVTVGGHTPRIGLTPVAEEDGQDFNFTSAPQEALLAATRAALRPWAVGIGAHCAGGCGSCWQPTGRARALGLVERTPQRRGDTHGPPRAHASVAEPACPAATPAPMESRTPRPVSRQTITPTRNYPKKPRKTQNDEGRGALSSPHDLCMEHRRHRAIRRDVRVIRSSPAK